LHERASIAEVVKLIQDDLATPSNDPVGRVRQDSARRIQAALESGGYPAREADQLELSIIPYVFQEANYDDIDWWSRDSAKHGQLKRLLEIDFLTQMAGKRREDASDAEIEDYRLRSRRAIYFRRS
jgi:hypothetical protein